MNEEELELQRIASVLKSLPSPAETGEELFGLRLAEAPATVTKRYQHPVDESQVIIRTIDDTGLTTADKYDRVFGKAIKVQEEILDMELPDVENEHFGRVLSAKQAAATSVINSGLKADENRLRREKKEVLNALYERFNKTEPGKVIEGEIVSKQA